MPQMLVCQEDTVERVARELEPDVWRRVDQVAGRLPDKKQGTRISLLGWVGSGVDTQLAGASEMGYSSVLHVSEYTDVHPRAMDTTRRLYQKVLLAVERDTDHGGRGRERSLAAGARRPPPDRRATECIHPSDPNSDGVPGVQNGALADVRAVVDVYRRRDGFYSSRTTGRVDSGRARRPIRHNRAIRD